MGYIEFGSALFAQFRRTGSPKNLVLFFLPKGLAHLYFGGGQSMNGTPVPRAGESKTFCVFFGRSVRHSRKFNLVIIIMVSFS